MFDAEVSRLPADPPRDPSLLPEIKLSSALLRRYSFPLAFVGLAMMMPFFIFLGDRNAQLQFRGRRTDATVTSVAEGAPTGSRSSRSIAYSFSTADGNTYRGTCRCWQGSPYYDAKVGEHLPVRYLPSNPWVNGMADQNDGPPVFFFMIFPLFFLIAFSPLYGPTIKNGLRARKVFKYGRISKGTVVFVKRTMASWPNYMPGPSDLYIAFRTPEGKTVEGSTVCSNEWLLHHLPPGAEVNIAYMPDEPEKVVLLDEFIR